MKLFLHVYYFSWCGHKTSLAITSIQVQGYPGQATIRYANRSCRTGVFSPWSSYSSSSSRKKICLLFKVKKFNSKNIYSRYNNRCIVIMLYARLILLIRLTVLIWMQLASCIGKDVCSLPPTSIRESITQYRRAISVPLPQVRDTSWDNQSQTTEKCE